MPAPVDQTAVERKLARTYNHPSYDDPWEVVEDYQQVQTYTARHPDAGSSAVGQALNLPRGRVRPWLDGAMPDAMRALDTCWTRGWLPDDWDAVVHVFRATEYAGTPEETDEADPEWFPVDDLPFSEMWPTDREWLPVVLDGGTFRGRFVYEDGEPRDVTLETGVTFRGRREFPGER